MELEKTLRTNGLVERNTEIITNTSHSDCILRGKNLCSHKGI